MFQLAQAKLETISLLAHDKAPLIDIVRNQMYGHLPVEALHVNVVIQIVANRMQIVGG